MTIPARAHYCWIGVRLPWAYAFALLSAARRAELPEIILHHTDTLQDSAELRAIICAPKLRLSRIDPLALLRETGQRLDSGEELAALYQRIESPVMRTDILRAAILYLQGGIYLDLDTITLASLRPLLDARHFIGTEFIVWPQTVRASRSPAVWARHLALDVARKALRRMPGGWAMFRRVEHLYVRGVNNAAMGAEAHSRFFADYLRAMLTMSAKRLSEPYALGPDLLQAVAEGYRHDDLTIHAPPVFYPLPPEISEHWFRIGANVRLNEVLTAETRVAHWYASVRTKSEVARINPDYVRAHRETQLYSALAWSCIGDIEETG